MIINPQLFNLRLIIGALIMVILALGSFSYVNYKALTENQMFIEQEKTLVENELSEMISSYEEVDAKNASIYKQLEATRFKVSSILDSVKVLNQGSQSLSKNDDLLDALSKQNGQVQSLVQGLKEENKSLRVQTRRVKSGLAKTRKAKADTKTTFLSFPKKPTISFASSTTKHESKPKQIGVSKFIAEGISEVTLSENTISTSIASKTNKFHVCFVIEKNKLLKRGRKDYFIQILDPEKNIVSNLGALYLGETKTPYSAKRTINYNDKDIKICTLIGTGSDILEKGTYYVNIYNDGKKIGNTTFKLK